MRGLYHGDCLTVIKELPEQSVDLILCDLPYGCGKTKHKWDREIDLTELWKGYKRLLKPDGIVCLFGNEPFTSKLIQSNTDMFRYKMVWEKESPTGFLNSNYKPLSLFEDIVVFSKGTVGSKSKLPIRYYPQGLIQKEQVKRNRPNSTWRSGKGYGGNNKLNSDTEYVTHYAKQSLFAKSKRQVGDDACPITCDEVVSQVKSQIYYILHDPFISKARKMLTIEQFRNPELAALQTKQNYTDVMRYFTDLVIRLQEQGVLCEGDCQIMAAQFCLPITVWINLCDREPDREAEVMELVDKHIRQFFTTHGRDRKGEN